MSAVIYSLQTSFGHEFAMKQDGSGHGEENCWKDWKRRNEFGLLKSGGSEMERKNQQQKGRQEAMAGREEVCREGKQPWRGGRESWKPWLCVCVCARCVRAHRKSVVVK